MLPGPEAKSSFVFGLGKFAVGSAAPRHPSGLDRSVVARCLEPSNSAVAMLTE